MIWVNTIVRVIKHSFVLSQESTWLDQFSENTKVNHKAGSLSQSHNIYIIARALGNAGLRVCLCWGFTAQSTQWGHVERSQFT